MNDYTTAPIILPSPSSHSHHGNTAFFVTVSTQVNTPSNFSASTAAAAASSSLSGAVGNNHSHSTKPHSQSSHSSSSTKTTKITTTATGKGNRRRHDIIEGANIDFTMIPTPLTDVATNIQPCANQIQSGDWNVSSNALLTLRTALFHHSNSLVPILSPVVRALIAVTNSLRSAQAATALHVTYTLLTQRPSPQQPLAQSFPFSLAELPSSSGGLPPSMVIQHLNNFIPAIIPPLVAVITTKKEYFLQFIAHFSVLAAITSFPTQSILALIRNCRDMKEEKNRKRTLFLSEYLAHACETVPTARLNAIMKTTFMPDMSTLVSAVVAFHFDGQESTRKNATRIVSALSTRCDVNLLKGAAKSLKFDEEATLLRILEDVQKDAANGNPILDNNTNKGSVLFLSPISAIRSRTLHESKTEKKKKSALNVQYALTMPDADRRKKMGPIVEDTVPDKVSKQLDFEDVENGGSNLDTEATGNSNNVHLEGAGSEATNVSNAEHFMIDYDEPIRRPACSRMSTYPAYITEEGLLEHIREEMNEVTKVVHAQQQQEELPESLTASENVNGVNDLEMQATNDNNNDSKAEYDVEEISHIGNKELSTIDVDINFTDDEPPNVIMIDVGSTTAIIEQSSIMDNTDISNELLTEEEEPDMLSSADTSRSSSTSLEELDHYRPNLPPIITDPDLLATTMRLSGDLKRRRSDESSEDGQQSPQIIKTIKSYHSPTSSRNSGQSTSSSSRESMDDIITSSRSSLASRDPFSYVRQTIEALKTQYVNKPSSVSITSVLSVINFEKEVILPRALDAQEKYRLADKERLDYMKSRMEAWNFDTVVRDI